MSDLFVDISPHCRSLATSLDRPEACPKYRDDILDYDDDVLWFLDPIVFLGTGLGASSHVRVHCLS